MNIYVASSWRNKVYDFRAPAPGNNGFHWSAIDPDWGKWTVQQYREAIQHPIAKDGYAYDINALKNCDTVALVLPAGCSASWEFGYAMGQGKGAYVIQFEAQEPELMFREAAIITSMAELFEAFGEPQ